MTKVPKQIQELVAVAAAVTVAVAVAVSVIFASNNRPCKYIFRVKQCFLCASKQQFSLSIYNPLPRAPRH